MLILIASLSVSLNNNISIELLNVKHCGKVSIFCLKYLELKVDYLK